MPQFIKLPNGAIVQDSDIVLIYQHDINQHAVVIRGSPQGIIISGTERDVLESYLEVKVLEKAAANEAKLIQSSEG
jgi:hypothetical protein